MKPTAFVIANPAARRASPRKIQKAVELLRAAGHETVLRFTEKRGDAEEFAREASQGEVALLLAAGGDGTFNEVINGLAKSQTRMAILPMGTTNVLARELGVPADVEGAARAALSGREHPVSLGRVAFSRGEFPVTRYFCLMAGMGFDGEAVHGISSGVKTYWGKGAYILSGLKALAQYSPRELTFVVNGRTLTGYSAIVGKAARYGGEFRVTPDAELEKPELYACIMHGRRRTDVLRYAYGIMRGRHLGFGDISYLRTDTVRVEGTAHMQIDGDYLGTTPAEITVVPAALKLVF